jgi:hypothetical protein
VLLATLALFAFIFESPFAAVAVAGGAVSIPIIIHLLNRRRFRIVPWAAMRFLLAAQRKNSRRMRLEQLILLAVRCLILMLLVLAMASVTQWAEAMWNWMNPEGGTGVVNTGMRTHKILVLDGSVSMALKQGDTNCFERARALASQLVRDSAGGDGFTLVLMASPPRRTVPEPSEDPKKVAAEIDALRVTHGNADIAATLNTVDSLLQASPGKFLDKEVYFFTDMQQATWIAKQPAALGETLRKIRARAQTIFVNVGGEPTGNVAVTDLSLGDAIATTGRETLIQATLHNYSETREELSVRLFVGRARGQASDPPCELGDFGEKVVQAKRGQQTVVTFTHKFPSPGDYVVQVQAAHDGLEVDDVRSAVVTVKDTVPVMLVDGKSNAGQLYDRASEWLRNALNPFENAPPAFAVVRPKVLTPGQFADAGLGDLTSFDCVFLCDVPRFSAAEVARLESHVRRGGGVVFCMGDNVDLGSYNEAFYRGGSGLLPAQLKKKEEATKGYFYQFLVSADAERDPPLKAFQEAGARERLLASRFRQFIQTEPATKGGARKILSFTPVALPGKTEAGLTRAAPPTGGPALIEWNPPAGKDTPLSVRMRGKVLLVTTTVNADWNNWPTSPTYLPLIQEILQFAVTPRLSGQAVPVGDPLELYLPNSSGGLDAVIKTPDGRTETARTQALDDGSVLRWNDTDVSGVYKVTIGQHPREYLFAINVPEATEGQLASESDLTRASKEDLQKTYPEWDMQVVTDLSQVTHISTMNGTTTTVPRPQGPAIARWLLLVMFALLVTEVVLAWYFGHYTSVAAEGQALGNVSGTPRPVLRTVLASLPWLLFGFSLCVAAVLIHDAWTGDFLGFLPDSSRRWLEDLASIPPPAAGEGIHWRAEYLPYLFDVRSDRWLSAALVAGAAVLVFFIYRREGRGATTGSRILLVGLRCCLLLLMVVVLLPQLRLWVERQGWPDVVLLIDDSASMSHIDQYRDSKVRETADRLAKLANLTEADRLHLAQALLTRGDSDWLTTLLTKRKVRLHVYHCSGRAHRLNDVVSHEEISPAIEAIQALSADAKNDSSQLGVAVRQVLNDFRGSSLSAVVMLTDGVTTEGEDLVKVSKYSAQMGVPLFFVGVGDAHEARDVYLHDLAAAESVLVNDRIVFTLNLTAQGYDGLTAQVTLKEKGTDKVLDRKTVTVDPGGRSVKVVLSHKPSEVGEKIYEIETPIQQDEVDKENNRLERAVFVHDSKVFKVLYVEGYRRYEYHFIKTLLERESARTKGNKSVELKVLLQDADPDFAAQDRSALADFPTKKELETYDVIILGDVNPRPVGDNKMTEHLKDVADFVKEKGGGLLMIAGERYAPRAYRDTPLKDVLPIDITADRPAEEDDRGEGITEGYRPELTPIGQLHPIFRFSESDDEKENGEIWSSLRELFWYADGYQSKRAAEVLAVHPRLRRGEKEAEKTAKDGNLDRHPLILQQFVGAGRSMFFGINETWRWGYREKQLYFNRFWIQTVRFLARGRQGRINLRLDRQTPYRRGEPIKMTVSFPDDSPQPTGKERVEVVVQRRGPNKGAEAEVRTVRLAWLKDTRKFEATLTQTPEGDYKFWLGEPAVPNPKPRAECKVLAPPGEMELLRMNQIDMERAAEESHGRFYTLADADRLLDELPVGTRVTLNASGPPWTVWNHAAVFLMVLLYLSTEWLLRKQKNLL